MTKMLLFDRDEKLIGTIKNVLSAKHTEEVNGEDTLEVVLPDMVLEKGYKIVYKDKYGYWKEFIIRGIDELHVEEGIEKTVFCESSFYETIGDYIEDVRPQDVTANIALAQALVPTRWEVGQVDNLGLNSTNFYHTDAKTAVQNVAVTWKGELRTRVVVSGNKITNRYVDLLSRRGSDLGKRFTYEKDISEIKKTTVRDDVYTAIYGYGKGEEVGDGYGRRLDFADINGGKAYVENLEALAIWGRNNPDGSKKHVFGKVEFDDCVDKTELLQLTTAKLAELSVPAYIYEAKVYAIGLAHEQVGLGDTAAIIDKEFKPALRLKSRVVKIVEDLLEEENSEITFGNIVSGLIDDEIKNQQAIDNFKSKEGAYDRAGTAFNQDGNLDANFIDGLLDAFNTEANATGGYVFTKQGEGILTIDKPDEATSTMAIQIKGGMLRIANTKLPDGSWNWTTAMDGSGIIADIVNAGVLKGGKVQFDLENGTLLIGNSITDYSLLWDGSKLWLNGKGIESYATTTYVDTAVPHSIVLSNDNQSIPCDYTGATKSVITVTTAIDTYKGTTRIAATLGTLQLKNASGSLMSLGNVTLSKADPTSSASGSVTMTITANANLSADSGYIEIPITIESKTYTKRLTWNKAKDAYTPVKGVDYFDGQDGQDGSSNYLWIRYSQVSNGNPMTTDPTGALYIGTAVTTTNVAPSSYSSYSWSKIKGDQGIQGETGTDGQTSYLHIKYSNDGTTFTANSGETVGAWIGTYVDFSQTDSTTFSDYTWNKVKGDKGDQGIQGIQGLQGPKGDQGIQGPNGADGTSSYTHIAYANSADGVTGFSVSDSTNKLYIGIYVDSNATDSSNPASYAWTLIKGADGAQGIQGQKGADGLTPYFHTAYATNSTGTTGFSTTDTTGKTYIGTYTDYTAADSTDPAKYTWVLIQGPQGPQGATGASGKGVTSIVEQYYLSTSSTTQSGGSWVTTVPAWVDGKYMWTRSVITYTDNSTTTTSPVCVTGAKGTTGSTGSTGATGNGISSVDVQYYLSTSSTSLVGGTWSTSAPAWVDGSYIWTKTVTTYTNSTTVESNPACITGAKGATGTAGISVTSIVEEYYQSTSSTTQTGGSWSTTVPTWADGKYIWTRAKTTFSNATTSTTSPVCVTGQKGTNGTTTYTWVKYADDASGTGLSDSPSGKRYLGLAYNKTTATESTLATDYSWSPLYDNVQVGGRNLIVHVNEQKDMMVQTDGTFSAFTGSNLMADYISVTVGESLTFSQVMSDEVGDNYFRYAYYADDKITLILRKANNIAEFTESVPAGAFWLRVSYDATNNVKLERGNIATDYSDSPEDTQAAIDAATDAANNAQNAANNAQSTADGKANQSDVDDLADAVSQHYSEWQQDSNGLHGQVGTIQDSLDSTNDNVNKVYTYFDFLDTGLNIGKSDSPLQINISNSEMDFLDNGKVVAYVNGQMMYIDSLQVLTSLIVGNHKIEKYNTDITLIKWVG